jgi:pimeloyl-ACP methyl ester carboxylesterase
MMKLVQSIEGAVDWFDKYLAAPPEPAAQTADDRFFDSGGVKIHYVVEGQGEPIILVHGFTGSIRRDWLGLGILSKLSKNYQVIALDHRGHGKSEKVFDPAKYGVEMAADVVRLMDHLKLKKAHVVGYSLGGLITEYLLVNHPDRWLTATIGGMGWNKDDGPRLKLLALTADALESGKGMGPLVERLTPVGTPKLTMEQIDRASQQSLLNNDPKALAACLRGIPQLAVTEEQLKANQVPALAIIGEIDPLKSGVDEMEKVMSHLTVDVIQGADHGIALASPKFVECIDAFIRANSKVTAIKAN